MTSEQISYAYAVTQNLGPRGVYLRRALDERAALLEALREIEDMDDARNGIHGSMAEVAAEAIAKAETP